MSTPATPVLMSADHPGGWKLEDLLVQLRAELSAKNERIAGDASPTAAAVRANNATVIDLLELAEDAQRETIRRLDALRADPGPGGPPRIGIAPLPHRAPSAARPGAIQPTPETVMDIIGALTAFANAAEHEAEDRARDLVASLEAHVAGLVSDLTARVTALEKGAGLTVDDGAVAGAIAGMTAPPAAAPQADPATQPAAAAAAQPTA